MGYDVQLARTCAALGEVVPRLVALVRGITDADAVSVGTWTVGDVAAHLSHAFRFDLDALAGRPVPEAVVTTAGMAELNAKLLADDGERDPEALADRLGALADEFDSAASRSRATSVDWLQGVGLPPSAVAGHLLEECLMHGHDIARATGRPWPIDRHHALLAIDGGVLPLIDALPAAFVKQGGFQGRFEVRLRGGRPMVMDFDRGRLRIDAAGDGDVDAYISTDPAALMLLFIGRYGVARPILEGDLAAWGRRPWKLAGMLAAISPP
ncbi:uncharacterized protein (TIGR03083 family) [Kribbella sp. VKM Ac-2571]|uniref:maleylpyruvate isomerase N-terminal domain-containing protein n=1 Tax=Kribbella sp. VKM Ac-2571 TaxID=2512222 RepID=UPI00105F1202|nr:maleylpyruvate isomerase N-terminal domain-containing protein [Kribbella sp. VKM Ac-2571]TDO56743.1 uncharacterized protein (TIGR03083 family) [Kribbella sp. VKM Ac-2571]